METWTGKVGLLYGYVIGISGPQLTCIYIYLFICSFVEVYYLLI